MMMSETIPMILWKNIHLQRTMVFPIKELGQSDGKI